jgi:hypothetical protein
MMLFFSLMVVLCTIAIVNATSPVFLGTAGDYVIIAKAGISTVPASSDITGDIAVSPIAATGMTGFDLTMDSSNEFSTSTQITGRAYAANYGSPTPSKLTTAIGDMETAYTDAASRPVVAANLNRNDGLIGGETFTAGVYKWGSDIYFDSDIYITGGPTDIFIFQCTGNIVAGSGARVDVTGALASNIVWQTAGFVTAERDAHIEGIFLVKTKVVFDYGSSLKGRILAQTATTLDTNIIEQPVEALATRSLRGV